MSVHRKEVPVLLRKPNSAEVGNSDLDKQGFSRSHTLNIVCYMFKVNFIIIHVYILTTNTACTFFAALVFKLTFAFFFLNLSLYL